MAAPLRRRPTRLGPHVAACARCGLKHPIGATIVAALACGRVKNPRLFATPVCCTPPLRAKLANFRQNLGELGTISAEFGQISARFRRNLARTGYTSISPQTSVPPPPLRFPPSLPLPDALGFAHFPLLTNRGKHLFSTVFHNFHFRRAGNTAILDVCFLHISNSAEPWRRHLVLFLKGQFVAIYDFSISSTWDGQATLQFSTFSTFATFADGATT